MKCIKPIIVHGNQFNCGHCRSCRINYTSSWTLRLLYELDNWSEAQFITLTYNDSNLPKDLSLHPEDLQKFWKRLRKDLEGRKIKYYACGEYGDKNKRPHYHAIVFGLSPYSDTDRQLIAQNWNKCEPWLFDKAHNGIGEVTRESIGYVTGYVQKKLNGELAEKEYNGKIPPFSRCSQGMGLEFALKNQERLIQNGFTFLHKNKISIPRYFRDKLGIKAADYFNNDLPIFRSDEFEQLKNEFEKQMNLKGMLDYSHPETMARRFERWLNDFQFEKALIIEKDFKKRSRILGKL